MKKITLILMLCTLTLAAMAYPQTLPIDYTQFFATTAIGSSISLEKGVYLTTSDPLMANQWNRSGKLISGEGGGVSPVIENNTLSYSTYIDNNLGKAILLDPNILPDPNVTSSTFRTTIYSLTSSSSDYNGSFYIGMLVNMTTVSSSGIDFLAMDANYTGNSQRGRVFVRSTASPAGYYQMGVGFSGTSDVGTWSADLALGTTYFIVLKYTTAPTGGTETATLYLNPTLGETEAATTSMVNTVSATAALKSIKGFIIRQRPNMGGKLAGIRFSDNWEDVVKVSTAVLTPVSQPTVGTATEVAADGFTANWTAVAAAVGYDVNVYLGTNLFSSINTTGQSTSSLLVTGLMPGLTYIYKVVAKGDGIATTDSDPSASSAEVTTLDPYASNALNTDFNDNTWGTVADVQPGTGTYPTEMINGFNLKSAIVYSGSVKGIKGEIHTNRIALDKAAAGGMVEFPTVNSLEQMEIHATAGTAGNGFVLSEFNKTTNTWNAIGGTNVYDANSKAAGTDSIYIFNISRSVPSKFRIENPTNGGIYLLQVKTRTTSPALLEKPVVGVESGKTATGFTANWTPVSNATGYNVFVYAGTSLVDGAPFNIVGQSANTYDITGLTPETTYTYKVQAVGDGDVNYSDSFVSFPSAEITTLADLGTGVDQYAINKIIVSHKTIASLVAGDIEIFNIHGVRLLSVQNILSVDTQLNAGIYIVRFTDATGKIYIQKINIK